MSVVLEPSQGLFTTARAQVCWRSLAKPKHTFCALSEELRVPPLPLDELCKPSDSRGLWQSPLFPPRAAELSQTRRTNHDFGKQWETCKGTCWLVQDILNAFSPSSTKPLTLTLYQVLDSLILGYSLCRNWGERRFPCKDTIFLLDSKYYSLRCLPV